MAETAGFNCKGKEGACEMFARRFFLIVLMLSIVLGVACSSDDGAKTVSAGQEIKPRPVTETFTINTSEDVSLQANSGVEVSFSAGSLATEAGQEPSGTATVEISNYLHQTDGLPTDMPGGFEAEDENGTKLALMSFGAIGIEITDDAGSKLNLSDGSQAMIAIPVVSADAPAEVPLWHLADASSGSSWVQEGTCTVSGSGCSATVSHFSLWNADVACANACMKVSAALNDKTKISKLVINAKVTTTSCDYFNPDLESGGFCITDDTGSCTITGLPGDATVTVWAEYEGAKVEEVENIPAAGDSCVTAKTLVFGEPDAGVGPAPDTGSQLHPSCAGFSQMCEEAGKSPCDFKPTTKDANPDCWAICVEQNGGLMCDGSVINGKEYFVCPMPDYWTKTLGLVSINGGNFDLCDKNYHAQ